MMQEQQVFSPFRKNNEMLEDMSLNEPSHLIQLRKYLQEGNTIPLKCSPTAKKQKQKEQVLKNKDNTNQPQNKQVESTSSSRSNSSQPIVIDYNYVIECAHQDLLGTCEELLVFDQRQIFQKLWKQYIPKQKPGMDSKNNKKGINDEDLLNSLDTRELFTNYLSPKSQKSGNYGSKIEKDKIKDAINNNQRNKKVGIINKMMNIIKILGKYASTIKDNKNFIRLLAILVIIVLICMSLKYHKDIIKITKVIFNLK